MFGFIGDAVKWAGGAVDTIAGGAEKALGTKPNRSQYDSKSFTESQGYDPNAFNFGGQEGVSQHYQDMMNGQAGFQNQVDADLRDQGRAGYGMMASRDAAGRGQMQDATNLAQSAAMGNAPSRAENLMRGGMDQIAAQQGQMAAGARGAAAMANAQSNAQANTAAQQQVMSNNMGALRADEMAQARGLYGSMAGNLRQGDQSMIQGANQYELGMNQAALGRGQLAAGYTGQAAGVAGQQGQARQAGQMFAADQYNQNEARKQGTDIYNRQAEDQAAGRIRNMVSGGANTAATGLMGSAGGGSGGGGK